MKPLSGAEIRKRWIRFFESKGHLYVPGVSLIPEGDKSLLWVNAGVTGLKKYFDGSEIPPCRRIVNVQKSIRTNDIEHVGHTARHHTFFEMLGNFSIGDYFRKEAIAFAMEILTSEEGFALPKDKLYVTYNPDDLEAYKYWQENGLAADHLVPLESNFWQIGAGPCGPNTEVFFDRGEKYDPEKRGLELLSNDLENDRYIEIWGIVFSQYEAEEGKPRSSFKELPSKNIDTGAGLERLACILQGTETNFETDLFMPLIEEISRLSGQKYEEGNYLPFRVIADHSRCLLFALSDGASFSNEGRGYVLRRLLRRSMRFGRKLGLKGPFINKLLQVVADQYGDFYPNLRTELKKSQELVKSEEERFLVTLSEGEKILSLLLDKTKAISGEDAFKLYDTYGFPLELTEEIASERGVSVDGLSFQKKLEEQKERARSSREKVESFHKQSSDLLKFVTPSEYVRDVASISSEITGLFVDGKAFDSVKAPSRVALTFKETPFYAEMGGEISDSGYLEKDGKKYFIDSVETAPQGQHLHYIDLKEGMLSVGEYVNLSLDVERHNFIRRNHSATHLLHAALKQVLGADVRQMGSFVGPDYLRFDFNFSRKLTSEELNKIEELVNRWIAMGLTEKTEVLALEDAKKTGAEAQFQEKYGDFVRVVSFGDVSKEFCGGCHVENSAEIGLFSIESEAGIASGVRRIIAITSFAAYKRAQQENELLIKSAGLLKATKNAFFLALQERLKNDESLAKELAHLKDQLMSKDSANVRTKIEKINDVSFLFLQDEKLTRNDLMRLADQLKSNLHDFLFVLIGGEKEGYPLVVLANGSALKIGAKKALSLVTSMMGGKGGGRENFASGRVESLASLKDSEKALKELL